MLKKIRAAKIREEGILPRRKNPTDAGMDFYAPYDIMLYPHEVKVINTFISVEVPEGYMLLIKPKSSNNHLVGAGVIDAYYHPGPIMVKLVNPTNETLVYRRGSGIAQGIFIKIEAPEIKEVSIKDLENDHPRSKSGGILRDE